MDSRGGRTLEKDLSILTDEQRTAYQLRQQGLSFKEIGARMNTSASLATRRVRGAERRFREFEWYHDKQRRNDQPVDFPLTRGELEAIVSGLTLLERDMIQKIGGIGVRKDWRGHLSYEAQVVDNLLRRAQLLLYGKVIFGYDIQRAGDDPED